MPRGCWTPEQKQKLSESMRLAWLRRERRPPRERVLTEAQRERQRGASRKWYHNNKDRAGAYARGWREKHLEHALEYNRSYKRDNPEKIQASNKRDKLQRLYGLSVDEFGAMLTKQGFTCAICKREKPENKSWHIDHDHKTGRVRGILCNLCNMMLGCAKDNATTLTSAIQYLGAG